MSIKVNPPPLQVPNSFLGDKQAAAFFNGLLNTIYQLWTSVYGLRFSAKVNTTDATPTALVRTPVQDGKVVLLQCYVVAHRTGGSAGTINDGAWYVMTGAYRNTAGVLTGIGTPDVIQGEDQAGWDVAFSSSSTDAVIVVTGAANNNITWQGTLSVYEAGA